MRFVLTAAALLVAAPLFGQTKNDLDAQAALALQKAKVSAKAKAMAKGCPCPAGECKCAEGTCPNCPALDKQARAAIMAAIAGPEKIAMPRKMPEPGPDLNQPLSWDEAAAWTRRTHKPVLVRSGAIDCSKLCPQLRPEIPVAHVEGLRGETRPQLRLMIADQAGNLMSAEPWFKVPTEAEVWQRAAELKRVVDAPPAVPVTYTPNAGVPCRT